MPLPKGTFFASRSVRLIWVMVFRCFAVAVAVTPGSFRVVVFGQKAARKPFWQNWIYDPKRIIAVND